MLADQGVPGEAIAEAYDAFEKGETISPLATAAVSNQSIQESMKLLLLVRAYQVHCMMCPSLGQVKRLFIRFLSVWHDQQQQQQLLIFLQICCL